MATARISSPSRSPMPPIRPAAAAAPRPRERGTHCVFPDTPFLPSHHGAQPSQLARQRPGADGAQTHRHEQQHDQQRSLGPVRVSRQCDEDRGRSQRCRPLPAPRVRRRSAAGAHTAECERVDALEQIYSRRPRSVWLRQRVHRHGGDATLERLRTKGSISAAPVMAASGKTHRAARSDPDTQSDSTGHMTRQMP